MKSGNSIYAFFIFLALLFWNPATFYLIYGSSPVNAGMTMMVIFTILFSCGLLAMFLILKDKVGVRVKNFMFAMAFSGICFALFFSLDSLYGLTSAKTARIEKQKQLLFEPNSTAVYKTVEFSYTARINSLGLRDREISMDKGDKFRILCFGDSWTFGWGVELENSWPKKLENYLHQSGFTRAEVINCGQGGQYPTVYREYMEKAIPVLKPDLVLVGVLQAEDLAQLYEYNYIIKNAGQGTGTGRKSLISEIASDGKEFLKYSFRHVLALKNKNLEIKSTWKSTAGHIINSFTDMERIRFNTLDDSLRSLFQSGDLNPGLLNWYINFPDRISVFNNPLNPATRFAMEELNSEIAKMKGICLKNNCKLVFINMPINFFNGHQVIRTPGDELNSWFEQNNRIDSIYAAISKENGLPYLELTTYFRGLEDKTAYYYTYDGHPNSKGYDAIAGYISRQLTEQKLIQN